MCKEPVGARVQRCEGFEGLSVQGAKGTAGPGAQRACRSRAQTSCRSMGPMGPLASQTGTVRRNADRRRSQGATTTVRRGRRRSSQTDSKGSLDPWDLCTHGPTGSLHLWTDRTLLHPRTLAPSPPRTLAPSHPCTDRLSAPWTLLHFCLRLESRDATSGPVSDCPHVSCARAAGKS